MPSRAPMINITASQRNSLEVTLAEIDTTSWNGVPLGYRIYFQSVLKLEQPGNLLVDYVEGSYDHVNFTVNVNFTESGNLSYPIILQNLDVFTNYSIIAGAYSSPGVGPLRQIFWRTNQGGKTFEHEEWMIFYRWNMYSNPVFMVASSLIFSLALLFLFLLFFLSFGLSLIFNFPFSIFFFLFILTLLFSSVFFSSSIQAISLSSDHFLSFLSFFGPVFLYRFSASYLFSSLAGDIKLLENQTKWVSYLSLLEYCCFLYHIFLMVWFYTRPSWYFTEPEVSPSHFKIKALNSTHLNASWSMTDDIELLNGWFVSNYSIIYEEFSTPSVAVNGSMTLIRNELSVIIGPLDPWREYRVSVAGNVQSRPGVFISLCVRTDEDGEFVVFISIPHEYLIRVVIVG